jgi:hypothetical protein
MGPTPKRRKRTTSGTQTTDYVRAHKQWVKIIRDSKKRTFYFARGYESEIAAHHTALLPFSMIPTWADAIAHAERMIDDYK